MDALKAEEKRVEDEEKRREQEIQEWEDHLAGKGYKNRWYPGDFVHNLWCKYLMIFRANRNCDKEREALEQQARVKTRGKTHVWTRGIHNIMTCSLSTLSQAGLHWCYCSQCVLKLNIWNVKIQFKLCSFIFYYFTKII